MRRTHLAVGVLTLAVFLLTGAYMRVQDPPVRALGDGMHVMFTSRHIYILAASVANVLLGCYATPAPRAGARILQRFASGLLVFSAIMLVAAFFYEPVSGRYRTLVSSYGLYALFAGAVGHLLASGFGGVFGAPRNVSRSVDRAQSDTIEPSLDPRQTKETHPPCPSWRSVRTTSSSARETRS